MRAPRFQFHKGTIKTRAKRIRKQLVGYFNSIKVQLKLIKFIQFEAFLLFQFHKGTIKTVNGALILVFVL